MADYMDYDLDAANIAAAQVLQRPPCNRARNRGSTMTAQQTRKKERTAEREVPPALNGPGQSVPATGLLRRAYNGAIAAAQRERLSMGT